MLSADEHCSERAQLDRTNLDCIEHPSSNCLASIEWCSAHCSHPSENVASNLMIHFGMLYSVVYIKGHVDLPSGGVLCLEDLLSWLLFCIVRSGIDCDGRSRFVNVPGAPPEKIQSYSKINNINLLIIAHGIFLKYQVLFTASEEDHLKNQRKCKKRKEDCMCSRLWIKSEKSKDLERLLQRKKKRKKSDRQILYTFCAICLELRAKGVPFVF